MTDHVHPKGEFSIAYTYMNMDMHGNMNGSAILSNADVFKTYMMAPHDMTMQMHMLMPMYGITSKLTAMAMINYNVNTMRMNMMPMQTMNMPGMNMSDYSNMPSSSSSSGLGDTKLYLLYNLLGNCMHRLVASAGVSFPTGSINVKGQTLQGSNDVLPYSMQLGSGTYNALPGLVYVGQTTHLTFGAAVTSSLKIGLNSRQYRWGNEYSFSPWIAWKLHHWASISLRGEVYSMDKMTGYDAQIYQSSLNDPIANTLNYGTLRTIAYAGMNFYANGRILNGARLFLEYGMPAWQYVNGTQMPLKSTFTIKLQYPIIKK
jgi:hypothetical protein